MNHSLTLCEFHLNPITVTNNARSLETREVSLTSTFNSFQWQLQKPVTLSPQLPEWASQIPLTWGLPLKLRIQAPAALVALKRLGQNDQHFETAKVELLSLSSPHSFRCKPSSRFCHWMGCWRCLSGVLTIMKCWEKKSKRQTGKKNCLSGLMMSRNFLPTKDQ